MGGDSIVAVFPRRCADGVLVDCEEVFSPCDTSQPDFNWRIIETAFRVTYASGISLDTLPGTFTPPNFPYSGFMELQYREIPPEGIPPGPYFTVKSWVTSGGRPTVFLP